MDIETETEFTLTLKLTQKEVELLRNSTSDLGTSLTDCVTLQLKIANALLDAGYRKDNRRISNYRLKDLSGYDNE